MSRSITIGQVPDELCDALKGRASRAGQSLEQDLLDLLASLAGETDPRRWMAELRERKRRFSARMDAARILELRDRVRR